MFPVQVSWRSVRFYPFYIPGILLLRVLFCCSFVFVGFSSLLLITETLNLNNRFFNEDSAVLGETEMRDALLERRSRKGLWVGISSSTALSVYLHVAPADETAAVRNTTFNCIRTRPYFNAEKIMRAISLQRSQ